jgi:hypothetical protein
MATISTMVFLIFSFNYGEVQASTQSIPYQIEVVITDSSQVQFYLKNNSILLKKRTFIIYQPEQEGNNTLVKWFLPFQKVKFDLPVKTRIYIASDPQVDTVMQGKRIDDDKPFLTVDRKINNITLQLDKRE